MAWPTDPVATGDLITATMLNALPILIAESEAGVAVASFDIASIPSHYENLLLIAYLRGTTVATTQTLLCRFNNDSGANYDSVTPAIRHSGVLTTGESVAGSTMRLGDMAAASAPASAFDSFQIVIPGYAETTAHKTASADGTTKAAASTGNLFKSLGAGWWRSTAAINRITLLPGANNFEAGSRVALYGMP